MHFLTLLLAIVSLTVIEAKFGYDGLVLTSIDVKAKPIDGRPNRVEFYGDMNDGTNDDDTAVFLTNITMKTREDEEGRLVLEGDVVDPKEVPVDLKPLLCIHGFNVSPMKHMEECKKAQKFTEEFTPIPVIWPAKGNSLLNYPDKRVTESVGAGKAFKTLNKYACKFRSKSLHAHSMGNRVLRYAADAGFTFDNIFMVAADTDARMFDKDYIENNEDDGLKIGQMIKNPKGKIHVLYNPTDLALLISGISTDRLGRTGAKEGDGNLHPALVGKVSSYNYRRNHLPFWRPDKHNYHFDRQAMEYFDAIKRETTNP